MKELVEEIDSHVEFVNHEITSNPNVVLNLVPSQFPNSTTLPTVDTALTQPNDPAAWGRRHFDLLFLLLFSLFSFIYFHCFIQFAHGYRDVVTEHLFYFKFELS